MNRNRLYIGKRYYLRKYLRGRERFRHLLVTPSYEINTLRFWSHLLKMESTQPCSSIIFTRNPETVERIETIHLDEKLSEGKVLLHLNPDHPDSLSLDPLFHWNQSTVPWLCDFFLGDKEGGGRGQTARIILEGLLRFALDDRGSKTTLPGIYRQAGLGIKELKDHLRFRGRPGLPALLNQMNALLEIDQMKALRKIHHRLSLFHEDRIARLFSSPTVYAPIYAHEPTALIVSVSKERRESDQILRLALLSIVHQLVSLPKHRSGVPIYLHLDGLDPLPFDLMTALTERGVGLTCLAGQAAGYEGCGFHIEISEPLSRLTWRGRGTKWFHPVLDGLSR